MAAKSDEPRRDFGTPIWVLVVAACVVVLVAGLRAASSVIEPFLIALFVVTLSLPVLFWLDQRLPAILAVLGTILLDIAVLAAVGSLVGTTVNQLAGDMDKYEGRLTELIDNGSAWLEERGLQPEWLAAPAASRERPNAPQRRTSPPKPAAAGAGADESAAGPESGSDGGAAAGTDTPPVARAAGGGSEAPGLLSRLDSSLLFDFANQALRYTATAFSSLLIISFIVIFMLVEAATFRAKVRLAFTSEDAEERFSRVMHEIRHYIGIKTVVSAATGLLIGAWVGLLGVDFFIFWGLVAFVLNFIPNLGSIIAAVPTTLLAMVQIGVGRGLLVAFGYLVVNMVVGNLIEPHLMGRRLGLSTLVVVLSLVFWGWVWGPIGMLLSVPLTMVLKIMLENTEEFRWVAVLLGDSREAERMAPASGGDKEA